MFNEKKYIMAKEELVEIKKDMVGHGLLIDNDGYVTLNEGRKNIALKESINESEGWHVPYPFIVSAVFQKFGIKNANGRIYPEDVLKREVEKYKQKILEHRALGEANHPSDTTINLSRVSHNITELHWEGRTLVGEMELNTSEGFRKHGIVTTCGDEMANLLMNGYKIGVSSRGCGSVESRLGQYVVGDDFELVCWDIVSDPSTSNAYISIDGREGLETYIENNQTNSSKNQLLEEKLKKINNLLS